MTTRLVVALESERLRAVAAPNGRARYPVVISVRGSDATLGIGDANFASEDERAKLLAQLPADVQDEGRPLLANLAAEVTRRLATGEQTARARGNETRPIELPWDDAVDGARLLADLRAAIERYVALTTCAATMLAVWVLHTYVTDVTDYTPYVWVSSPVRECGKSVLLEVLLHLAYAAQMSGGYTAAALYRRIARNVKTTMLLDELDTRLRGDGGEAIRGVLNTGFHRSGKVTVCVGDTHEDKDFPTFCPKVLSGIGRVWDTVASRSIPVRMSRASKEELRRLKRVRGDRIAEEFLTMRRKALRWSQDATGELRESDPEVPDGLGARQADVWRPLFAIADYAGGEWPNAVRQSALVLHRGGDEETDDGLLLLSDVRELLADGDSIPTRRLLEELTQREDRPWSEYRHEKPIAARGIASLLGRFGIKPQTIRCGATTEKGYSREKLAPAFNLYLERPTPTGLSVTSVTSSSLGNSHAPAAGGRVQLD